MATAGLQQLRGRSASLSWIAFSSLGVCLLASLLSKPLLSLDSWSEFEFELLGWLCFSGGALMRWWCALYMATGQPGDLVTTGPYSICRNPLLLGNLLLGASLACILGSMTLLVGLLAVAGVFLAVGLPAEEARLLEAHGETYARYRRGVPRFWPRLKGFQSPEYFQVDTAPLRPELWRTMFWVWLPVIAKVLAQLRAETWWPKIFGLP